MAFDKFVDVQTLQKERREAGIKSEGFHSRWKTTDDHACFRKALVTSAASRRNQYLYGRLPD